jgi:uncharacterized protein (DUF697 family)
MNKKPSSDVSDSIKLDSDPTHVPPSGTAEEQIAEVAAETRRAEADNTVKNHVMIALSLGLVPLPLFDLALLTGSQIKMVHSLSGLYGQPFAKDRVKAIVISLISGSAPVLGVIGLSSGAKIIPGIGSLVGSGGVAVTGGALTYAVGRVFVQHFESGGTLLNFDLSKARASFKKELHQGREAVAKLRRKDQPPTATVADSN